MGNWRDILTRLQEQAGKISKLLWAAGAVVLASLGVVLWLELSGPPYAVLSEGLSPSDGGKVIAQLQKLGIPYQLQAAGMSSSFPPRNWRRRGCSWALLRCRARIRKPPGASLKTRR